MASEFDPVERIDELYRSDLNYFLNNLDTLEDAATGLDCVEHIIGLMKTDDPEDPSYTGISRYTEPLVAVNLMERAFAYVDEEVDPDAVARLFNEVLFDRLRLPVIGEAVVSMSTEPYTLSSCGKAEYWFGVMLAQLQNEGEGDHPFIDIFHTEDRTAVIVQKTHSEPSGITLEPIEVNGITLPPGTIVGPSRPKDADPSGSHGSSVTSYEIDDSVAVQPTRFTPWVYDDPELRDLFAVDTSKGSVREGRLQGIRSHTIDDFREATASVLKLCKVKPKEKF